MKFVFTVILLLSLALPTLAQGRSCPVEVIRKDQISSVIERRQSTFKHCLNCEGDQCEFSEWPEEGRDFAKACRVLFCTPKKRPKKTFMSQQIKNGSIFFTYGINKDGRVKDVDLTEYSVVSEEQARKLIRSYFERRRYEPIVIDGKTYELNGLNDGTRFKIRWRYE